MTIPTLIAEFRHQHQLSAVGAGVVERDGTTRIEVAGSRSHADPTPAAETDCWHIGSCAKAITAVLFALQVERGLATWETPLVEILEDVGPVAEGWSALTMEQLLIHRSGLPANLSRHDMRLAYESSEPLDAQRTEAARHGLSVAPDRPGDFRYSNLGYILLGAALDRLTGTTFETAVVDDVMIPLGIRTAAFGAPPLIQGHRSRHSLLMRRRSRPVLPSATGSDNPPVMNSAGRLHLSLPDWAKFLGLFITSENPLLAPETVDRLLEPVGDDEPRLAMGWVAAPRIPGVSLAQQGSNTMWSATAVLGSDAHRAAFVVWNDGRPKLLAKGPKIASTLLAM